MKVLVVGGGGREHALCWKIAQSERVAKVWCAPGNAGTAQMAPKVENAPVKAEDLEGLLRLARREKFDLTVVGPEAPLCAGLADRFRREGLRVFGPSKKAARLEGSKIFAKTIMRRYGIPTAEFQTFTELAPARQYVEEIGVPCVIKADGLAAGKGVTVARDKKAALAALEACLVAKVFGEAGAQVVIEECLFGEEASLLALTDGHTIVPLESAQDHKSALDDDEGPNTGGMGAYSPAPVVTPEIEDRVIGEILVPLVHAMNREGCSYQGVIYAGLMITDGLPKVLEFNVRFGDPECQPIVMRLKSDLVELLELTVDQRLSQAQLEWDPRPAVCVVLAAAGYPGKYETGQVIEGLEALPEGEDVVVFHAGTVKSGERVLTAGGRVLGVTGRGKDIPAAIACAYAAVERLRFAGAHFRRDIGQKALRHLK